MSTPSRSPRRTPRRPAGAPDEAVGRAEAGWAGVLLLLAVVLDDTPLPWALLAALPALGAVVLGIRLVVLRRRARQRGGAVWAVVGVVLGLYVLAAVAGEAVLYGPVDEYRTCRAAANTDIAAQECTDTLRTRVGSVADAVAGG